MALAVFLLLDDHTAAPFAATPAKYDTVAIFGSSGTAGDGILKAALANPYIGEIHARIAKADAVYWAIGTSSVGVDEETHGVIHVDLPVRFVREWLGVSDNADISFHYISSAIFQPIPA